MRRPRRDRRAPAHSLEGCMCIQQSAHRWLSLRVELISMEGALSRTAALPVAHLVWKACVAWRTTSTSRRHQTSALLPPRYHEYHPLRALSLVESWAERLEHRLSHDALAFPLDLQIVKRLVSHVVRRRRKAAGRKRSHTSTQEEARPVVSHGHLGSRPPCLARARGRGALRLARAR